MRVVTETPMPDKRPEYVIETPKSHHKLTLAPNAGYQMVVTFDPSADYWPGRFTMYDDRHAYWRDMRHEHLRALRDRLNTLPLGSPEADEAS